MRKGAQTLVFESKPVILSHAAIGGKKEGEGPLAAYFDFLGKDAKLSQNTFEKAESKLQELALDTAKRKLGVSYEDIDVLFAGDLLNQCISSSFAARGTSIPFLGLYGACSTMAESLLLAAAFVDAGFARTAAALTSSHFASAERQYRFPLGYGGQRTPTAQWTVTGSGCCIVGGSGSGVRIEAATIGRVQDLGIKDANNMGAAMAPAAIDTLQAHFRDLRRVPQDYDLIVTGDLGALGKKIVLDQFQRVGVDLTPVYDDCGVLIYDPKRQDVRGERAVRVSAGPAREAGAAAAAVLRDGRAALADVELAGRVDPRHLPCRGDHGGRKVRLWTISRHLSSAARSACWGRF